MARVLIFVLLVLVALLALASAFRPASSAAETVPDCYVVRLRPGWTAQANAESLGLNWYRVTADSQAKAEQVYAGKYDAIEPCYVVKHQQEAAALVNDPSFSQQWGLHRVNAPTAWDVTRGDGKVVVVVFDTGLDTLHSDMRGKWYGGKSFVNTPSDFRDGNGHGTHTSGLIAAATNNALGVAGVGYNTKVSIAQVLNANGSGDTARIAQAMIEAANAIPAGWRAVFNFSLGCECPPPQILTDATAYAASKDIVLVAAAGNANADTRYRRHYPAAFPQFISVAATDFGDRKAVFSNYGPDIDLAAPGVDILSTWTGGYRLSSGTSMAAPHVAAVAGLVRAARPDWTAEQVRTAILATARRPIGYNVLHHGAGVVDAGKAVRYGGGVIAPPTQPPRVTPIPTPTPAPGGEWGVQLETLINVYRVQSGLSMLRPDDRLARAADTHNRWMNDNACFAHQCPGEPDPWQRMRNAGYPLLSGGENIGQDYTSPQHMLQGWQQSDGHNWALLNTYWPDIGCAYLDGAAGHYRGRFWTCGFARPASGKDDLFSPFALPGPLGASP